MRTRSFGSTSSDRREAGSAMIFVVLLVLSSSVLSLALLSSIRSNQQEARGSRQEMNAFYLCEAGVSAAVRDLANGGQGLIGSAGNPVELGAGNYWVTAAPLGSGISSLQATGGDAHSTVRAEVIVRQAASGLYTWGAFADEGINMDSNAMTDSYDSSLGTYASQEVNGSGNDTYANTSGNVGSNADISMDGNTIVYGNAVPGPSGNVARSGSSVITGSITPALSPLAFPPITVPSLISLGALSVSADLTLPPGDYRYDELSINATNTLLITGPARLVCEDFVLKSNSQFRVDASAGPVEIYVENDFIMSSNTLVASLTMTPADVAFYLLSDNIIDPMVQVNLDPDELTFNSNAILYGTVYAPNAQVEIDSNFELFGSLVARRVDLDSNAKIHYDEALARTNSGGSSAWEVLCWRILP